jgi:hypothetical protein
LRNTKMCLKIKSILMQAAFNASVQHVQIENKRIRILVTDSLEN